MPGYKRYAKGDFLRLCTKEKPLDRNNLFVVGDPRQSIYGFRYARAELFEQLQKDVTDSGGAVLSIAPIPLQPGDHLCVNGVFRPYFPKLEELQVAMQNTSVSNGAQAKTKSRSHLKRMRPRVRQGGGTAA